ncbi:hypothetical protein A2U01_0035451, partial [Trifolium medium]|nr:hypothetical protein [Trifolium medium]
MMVAKI